MTPVGGLALGLAIGMLDFRLNGFDVVPDAIGWIVVCVALSRLRGCGAGFGAAALSAGVAGMLSFADLQQARFDTVHDDGPLSTVSTTTFGPPVGVHGVMLALYQLAVALTFALVCRAMARAARAVNDETPERRFTVLSLIFFAETALAAMATVVQPVPRDVTDSAAAPFVVLVAIVGFIAAIWTIVELIRVRQRAYLGADAGSAPRRDETGQD